MYMLVEFSVSNFLSFKNKVTFSMVGANSVKELKETHLFKDPLERLSLLKTAAVYGANGSGKSNLFNAIRFMKNFTLNSFRDALLNEDMGKNINITKYLLDEESEKYPSFFEITFYLANIRYRYGFEVDEKIVHKEWLFAVKNKQEVRLFNREGKVFKHSDVNFKEGKNIEKGNIRDNVLVLSLLAHTTEAISKKIVDWFNDTLKQISGLYDTSHEYYTIQKIKDDEDFRDWVIQFIKFLDIIEITTESQSSQSSIIVNNPKNLVPESRIDKLLTWHEKKNKDGKYIDKVAFDFKLLESDGTKKLIYFLGPLYDVLKNGKILVVDEFDARFHTLLSLKIIDFFHYSNFNNAQLIVISHDTNLLKKEIFRRDQIWFAEKSNIGFTDIYSMVEYKELKIRNDASFEKNYLSGKYGAIPYFGNITELLELIYKK